MISKGNATNTSDSQWEIHHDNPVNDERKAHCKINIRGQSANVSPGTLPNGLDEFAADNPMIYFRQVPLKVVLTAILQQLCQFSSSLLDGNCSRNS